jgi:hypothetical protein
MKQNNDDHSDELGKHSILKTTYVKTLDIKDDLC